MPITLTPASSAAPAATARASKTHPPAVTTTLSWLARAARESLVHFLLLGGLVFAASESVEHYTTRYRVAVAPDRIDRLTETYRQQFGQDPTKSQLKTLVDNYVREEIEYRESLALGLDRDDEIVRRRLVQKYEFLQQDLQSLDTPSDATLRAFYTQHQGSYGQPERRAFTQVYFSPDKGDDGLAHDRATEELPRLRASGVDRAPQAGDVFSGPSDLADLSQGDAERLFGSSELSQKLYTAPQGQWVGPYKSGFGWHLLRVTGITPARPQPYEAVAARVLDDWRAAQREAINAKSLAALRSKYNVVVEAAK